MLKLEFLTEELCWFRPVLKETKLVEETIETIIPDSCPDVTESLFAGGMAFDIAYQGVLSTILVVVSYLIGHYMESGIWEFVNSPDGMTMAFLTLSMLEIFHSLNMRSQRKSLFSIKGQNGLLWLAVVASFLLTTAVIYVPFLQKLFDFTAVSFAEYAVAIGLAFLMIPVVEIVKLIQRKLGK